MIKNNYIKAIFLIILILPLLQCSFFKAIKSKSVFLTTSEYFDEKRDRKIKIYIWQPVSSIGKNDKSFPLIIFSHGTRGSADNYSWLTVSLAEKGFIVVGVDHYNDTWYKYSKEGQIANWERPQDITFVINRLLQDSTFSNLIDKNRIAAAGHSSGGYTSLALAGALFKMELIMENCSKATDDLGCAIGNDVEVGYYVKNFQNARMSYKDNRIKAVFVMEPALGYGIDKSSLEKINIPVYIVGCQKNDFLSYKGNAYYYAQNIPNAKLKTLDKGEGHFIFIDKCHGLGNLFYKQICIDKDGINRENIHKEIAEKAYQFFNNLIND